MPLSGKMVHHQTKHALGKLGEHLCLKMGSRRLIKVQSDLFLLRQAKGKGVWKCKWGCINTLHAKTSEYQDEEAHLAVSFKTRVLTRPSSGKRLIPNAPNTRTCSAPRRKAQKEHQTQEQGKNLLPDRSQEPATCRRKTLEH